MNRGLGGSDTEVTGGAGIEWTPTPDIFAYARYSRGYAPIAFSAGTISVNPEVTPEFLNSYEIGYKQNFGHQLSIDVAAFYYDYDELQLPISVNVGGVIETAFINYPKAEFDRHRARRRMDPGQGPHFHAVLFIRLHGAGDRLQLLGRRRLGRVPGQLAGFRRHRTGGSPGCRARR